MYLRLIVLLLPSLLSSCALPGSDAEPVSRKHPNEPDIQLNPNPVHARRVTLTLEDAPGPFRRLEGFAHYQAHHQGHQRIACGYRIWGAGANITLRRSEPFELKKLADNVYQGVAYSDRLLNEDYGKGFCQWSLKWVSVRMRANDNWTDTRFSPYLSISPIMAAASEKYYFWNGMYPRTSIDGYIASGDKDKTSLKTELQTELFTATIDIKEAQ